MNFETILTQWGLAGVVMGVAVVATWLMTKGVIGLYKKFGWDKQHGGKLQGVKDTHQGNIPRGGGLAIFGGIAISVGVWGGLEGEWGWITGLILLGGLLLTVTGVLDDIYDLPAIPRLVVNLIVGVIVAGTPLTINFVSNFLGTGVIDLTGWQFLPEILTVIYVVALMNITNWSKGVDGQMPGMVAVAAIFMGLIAFQIIGRINEITIFSGIVAGAFLGFLGWNFYPQKIMPGYGGGSLAGYFLAVLSIMAGAKLATVFMVLAVPVADAVFTILRRIIAGKSIFLGDRGHLHHKLLDKMGWGRRRIAIFYWGVTLAMGCLALVLPTLGKVIAFILVMILVWYFLIWVKLKSRKLPTPT
jgi:UDP-GlcNAc:undecaprenyl-phosphate GlcNAc-1-phosphate transferase